MKPLAPRWHTAVLAGIFLALAVSGALFQRGAPAPPGARQSTVPLYVSLIVVEWGLVLFVWRGGRRFSGTTLHDWIGGNWGNAKGVFVDAGLALGLWCTWKLLEMSWEHFLGPGDAAAYGRLLPRGAAERGLWIVVSLSAGFAEELAFRGYFLRQFAAFTRRPRVGLVLQAALFGIAHGYQGVQGCLKIALYGVLFGAMALWRRNLRPGMMAHAWTDILGGLSGG